MHIHVRARVVTLVVALLAGTPAVAGPADPETGSVPPTDAPVAVPAAVPTSGQVPAAAPAAACAPLRDLVADWGGFTRYREANRMLPADSRPDVVFIGDSITELWGGADASLFGPKVLARGISGQTSQQMLLRFEQDVIALRPRVVHVMAGTNDIAGNGGPFDEAAYRDTIRALVTLAKAAGIRVVLASIPPSDRFDWNPGLHPAATIVATNRWLRSYAAESGAIYADYHPTLRTDSDALRYEFGEDGVHPNARGYEAMRPIARRALDEALAGAR